MTAPEIENLIRRGVRFKGVPEAHRDEWAIRVYARAVRARQTILPELMEQVMGQEYVEALTQKFAELALKEI